MGGGLSQWTYEIQWYLFYFDAWYKFNNFIIQWLPSKFVNIHRYIIILKLSAASNLNGQVFRLSIEMWFKINDKFNLVLMNHQSIYTFQWIKHVPKKKICWKFWNVQLLRLPVCWNQVSACGAFDVLIRFFFLRLTKDQVSYAVNDRHLRTLMLNGTSLKDWSAVKKVMDFFLFQITSFLIWW